MKKPDPYKYFIPWLREWGFPIPEREYQFYQHRKWRADFCWPNHKIILEVEGGIWKGGAHTRGVGFLKDVQKYNVAAILGYVVLRVIPKELCTTTTIDLLRAILYPDHREAELYAYTHHG